MKRRPLEGIRVTDFTWIGAGSYTTRMLADAGADVIKIESSARLDSLRLAPPYRDGVRGVNRSGYFADRNSGKRSVTINMKHPRALDIITRLIAQSDIIANNFTPGVMEKFGLGYESVRAMKNDIVYLAMSMQGRGGPEEGYLGYGATMAAVTGIQHLTGLPGRIPAGTGTDYPDHIPNPCHAAFAVLAALRHRRRTGQGQLIDIAQTEPTIAVLGPSMLDFTVNGHVQESCGNDHPTAAPYGVYRCAGKDRWLAICVERDEQWAALGSVLGKPEWAEMTTYSSAVARVTKRIEVDAMVQDQVKAWDANALMQALQNAGVSAGVVNSASDIVEDTQLKHRNHLIPLEHAEMGVSLYNSQPFRTTSGGGTSRAAPLLGEHNAEVCQELLGISGDEFERMVAEKLLY